MEFVPAPNCLLRADDMPAGRLAGLQRGHANPTAVLQWAMLDGIAPARRRDRELRLCLLVDALDRVALLLRRIVHDVLFGFIVPSEDSL